jgi:GTPase SAR1 family protein
MSFAADYKQLVLTLVDYLKQLRNFSEKFHLEKLIQQTDNAIKRMETDSFSIAVVGEFKRGKSTFINAILGDEILPADILPTTATLNRVTYGSEPFVKIIFKDDEERDIAIHKLVSFVTKLTPECEAVAATVKEAVIYYPVNYCRQNVEIIDTPGLSDDENMTAVTLSVLEKVETAIMVTSVLAPFGESEGNFLTQKLLTTDLSQIIFVVTGIDHYKRHQDIEKVLKTVKQRIKGFVQDWVEENFEQNSPAYKLYLNKVGSIKIFGLSAYQALSAKIAKNDVLLAQSRFQEFEFALQKIVSQERGKILLQVVVNQVISISTEIRDYLNNTKNKSSYSYQEVENKYAKINNLITKLKNVKNQKNLQIYAAIDNIKKHINPLINQLEDRLKQAAEQIIESTETNSSHDINALLQQFATQVDNAVQKVSQSIAKEIQAVIHRELSTALQQASTLVEIASEVMRTVETHLNQFDENIIVVKSNLGAVNNSLYQALHEFNQEQLGNLSNLFPSSSEVFLLKDEANGLYTIVGGVAGSLFGPVGMAVGAAVGAGLGNSQKVKNFKKNYTSKVILEIEKQLRSHNSNQIVDDYVYATSRRIDKLKNHIDQELTSWIEDTQNTLAKLQGKQQAVVENEQRKINAMLTETQNILNHAWVLSEQLYQTMQQEDKLETKICPNCNYENAANCKFCIKCGTRLSE